MNTLLKKNPIQFDLTLRNIAIKGFNLDFEKYINCNNGNGVYF